MSLDWIVDTMNTVIYVTITNWLVCPALGLILDLGYKDQVSINLMYTLKDLSIW